MNTAFIPPPVSKPGKSISAMRRFRDQWDLQVLVIPSILLILLFAYVPMYGIIMAFQEFRLGDFPGVSEWVGMKQFIATYQPMVIVMQEHLILKFIFQVL